MLIGDSDDVHGNVFEWCQDWCASYPTGAATDPTGPVAASGRVGRGGSWFGDATYQRSANRAGGRPGDRLNNLGFRACLALQAGK